MRHSLKLQLLLGFCLVALNSGLGYKALYPNYSVYHVTPAGKRHVAALKKVEGMSRSVILGSDGVLPTVNQTLTVIVAPHQLLDFEKYLNAIELPFTVITKDLQHVLSRNRTTLNLSTYNTLEDINKWLDLLGSEFPGIVNIKRYGYSFNKHRLRYVRISYPPHHVNRTAVFIEAGMNGNEWIAPATALHVIYELLMSTSAAVREVARSYDWYIVPVANPDGYIHTHTVDRLWRKTRKPYNTTSFGANMYLNWDADWGGPGSSHKACSISYAGPNAHSEVETEALAKLVQQLRAAQLFISLHSFGQTVTYHKVDYRDVDDLVGNLGMDLDQICTASIEALEKRYGTKYTCDANSQSGTFTEWVYSKGLAKLAFSYRLRPGRKNFRTGFQMEKEQIEPTAKETVDSIMAMIAEAEKLNYLEPTQHYLPKDELF